MTDHEKREETDGNDASSGDRQYSLRDAAPVAYEATADPAIMQLRRENAALRAERARLIGETRKLHQQVVGTASPTYKAVVRQVVAAAAGVPEVEAVLLAFGGELEVVLPDLAAEVEHALWERLSQVPPPPDTLMPLIRTRHRGERTLDEMAGSRTVLYRRGTS